MDWTWVGSMQTADSLLGCKVFLVKDRQGWTPFLVMLKMFILSLFHVVLPSWPNGVLQTLSCRQKFQKPALLSFSLSSSEDHLANALVEGGGGCLKVIMVFNLHQWWFISSWPASCTDFKTWNRNYYLLPAHRSLLRISEGGEKSEGEKKIDGEREEAGKDSSPSFFFFAKPPELQSNLPGMWSYP